ncbi:hypothetical protein J4210_00570 [Candidatus Woesearchaeota archaeon]|nr:hypothetical protein [Candidatus Woesearchaeota archaeon]
MAVQSYMGFYSPQERWADNRQMYRQIAEGENYTTYERRKARENLAFSEHFPPDIPHDRLVGHILGIYQMEHPRWMKKTSQSRFFTPSGELKLVQEIDLGAELVRLAGGTLYREEIIERNVVRKVGKGPDYIRGDIFRKVIVEGSPLQGLEDYVQLQFDPGVYTFRLRKDSSTELRAVLYLVGMYTKIDQQTIGENRELLIPEVSIKPGAGRKTFARWVRRRGAKALDFILHLPANGV